MDFPRFAPVYVSFNITKCQLKLFYCSFVLGKDVLILFVLTILFCFGNSMNFETFQKGGPI